jgi:hypothetical protein
MLAVEDERAVSCVADMAVKGDDVRYDALRFLKLGFAAKHREFQYSCFSISLIICPLSAPSTGIHDQNIGGESDNERAAGSRTSGISCASDRGRSYAD